MTTGRRPVIATYGEVLWDCLPEGLFLGGAPFNVAYHAACLGADALPVTAVGRDFLGRQILKRAGDAGLDPRLIKEHESLPTGVALAELDEDGNAAYTIEFPAAWDEIRLDGAERRIIGAADALIYGTLATRSRTNQEELNSLLDSFPGLKICDINLRAPYDSIERAVHFAGRADVVKMNGDELSRLIGRKPDELEREEAIRECIDLLGVGTLLVTLGGDGAAAFGGNRIIRKRSPPVEVVDTVGAGDAFTAAFAWEWLRGGSLEDSVQAALDLGSFVAGRRGAQPAHRPS